MAVRILLADDHAIMREGLKALLEREGHEVVGEASTGHEAVRLAETHKPDVVVLDISMPLLNGIDAAREVQRTCSRAKILLLTMYADEHYVREGLRAGVSGYVLKTRASHELLEAIREIRNGDTYLSSAVSRTVVQSYLANTTAPPDPLTARERQVVQLVAEGKTTKEIASLLGIGTKTAETHRTHIMDKLDIHDTAGLVRYAIRSGIVSS